MTAEVVFWAAAAMLAYIYLGYPLLVAALAAVAGHPWRREEAAEPPGVSFIVPAHNEETVIAQKVRNCLGLDYPPSLLEVIVVCDGCTDSTADLARGAGDARVRVMEYEPRRGKPHALNAACAEARGDLLVFTDADVRLDRGALRSLVANFADARVGCVSGRTIIETRARDSAQGERAKYAFDRFLRLQQSRLGSLVGADGGFYAIRRSVFRPLCDDAVADDLALPIEIAEQGWRVVYEPLATAIEPAAPSLSDELRRKARIVAGAAPIALRWLHPRRFFRRDGLAFHLLSGKLIKYTAALWLAALLGASIALRGQAFYAGALAVQLCFHAWALLGAVAPSSLRARLPGALWLPTYFWGVNGAALVGLYRAATRRQSVQWERPPRVLTCSAAEHESGGQES